MREEEEEALGRDAVARVTEELMEAKRLVRDKDEELAQAREELGKKDELVRQMRNEWEGTEVEALRRELQRCEGMPGAQQEQTAAVVRVKREREAASEAAATKLEGELRARAAELAELRGKVREAEEQLECSICMERAVTTVLNPCGHCYCGDCASTADSCYTCLQPVAGKARLILG